MNDINTLRERLFAALAGLRDKSMDVATAKAMSDVAQTVINTAKVEIDHLRATGAEGRISFIPLPAPAEAGQRETATGTVERTRGDKPGITGITRHRIAG